VAETSFHTIQRKIVIKNKISHTFTVKKNSKLNCKVIFLDFTVKLFSSF